MCDRVMVLHEGKVYGDITAVSITVGPEVLYSMRTKTLLTGGA